MSLIVFIILVLIVLALLLYAVQLIPLPGPAPLKQLIMALIVVLAALWIAEHAGMIRL